ncbi:uncharacterized protein [Montipora foliosa]|uniref:uncharacterized protein isoform X1 n=2 Tax=Montipora foliosa TaxID=591990 RepID=UPI0035F11944
MSSIQKPTQPDKQRYGVYQILDAFIPENMLRRLLSFRKLQQESIKTAEDFQKGILDPSVQKTDQEVTQAKKQEPILVPAVTHEIESTESSKSGSTSEMKPNCHDIPCGRRDINAVIPDPCATLSDTESEAKSSLKDEAIVCEESDHCGSSTSEEDKEESGIEQDLEPKTKKPLTEVKRELRSQIKTSGKPLVPLVFSTLRPKNGLKATEKRSSCGVPCHNMDPRSTESGCVLSSQKSSIFIPSINSRQQYPRKPLTITSTKRPRRSKNPEMFGDILIKNDLRTGSLYQSPKRQDIVKRSSDSKPRLASAAAYATRKKKNKTIASKDTSLGRSAEKKNSVSSDSGLSDGEGSSGEDQKRMPVKKIFSNQQALRKKIDDLNGMLKTMEQQKAELQTVLRIAEDWSEDLRSVDRTNLGVPYIRSVKEIFAKQRKAIGNKKSDFNRRLTKLQEAEVPFNEELRNLFQQLKREITCVARDHRKYSAKSVEHIRHLQGRVIGTCTAIIAVYYEG